MHCTQRQVTGHGPPVFIMQGTVYHMIGSLIPQGENSPQFMATYIHDPEMEHVNRLQNANTTDPKMKWLLEHLQKLIHDCHPALKAFKNGYEKLKNHPDKASMRLVLTAKYESKTAHKRTYNTPTANEIAAVCPIDDIQQRSNLHAQDILLEYATGGIKFITASHYLYECLHYVTFMPHGDRGWNLSYKNHEKKADRISLRQYCAHRAMVRPEGTVANHFSEQKEPPLYFPTLQYGRRLFQQWIVDNAVRMEDDRLSWFRHNQKTICSELYQGLSGALSASDIANCGRRIVMPSSFSYGPRAKHQNCQDALAMCYHLGHPSYFITFTCNPQWTEIQDELLQRQQACDRPDLVARVFQMKLKYLLHQLLEKSIFGRVIGINVTIEFQKRGLPHAHMLLIVADMDRPKGADDYDKVVCAEIPSKANQKLRMLVLKHKIHGPCGAIRPSSPCMVRGECSKNFPKSFKSVTTDEEDSKPTYRRRSESDGGETAILNEGKEYAQKVDNMWVVPYNPALTLLLESHINVEIVTSMGCIKYLYKYINKGDDMTTMSIEMQRDTNADPASTSLADASTITDESTATESVCIDEIKIYQNARFISPPEGIWKMFKFPLQYHKPSMVRLPVHLQDRQMVSFDPQADKRAIQTLLATSRRTKLTAWFELNQTEENLSETDLEYGPPARELRYIDLPHYYAWKAKSKRWERRKTVEKWPALGRIYICHPKEGERFFLRLLLFHLRGAQSFEMIYHFDGVDFNAPRSESYQAVCAELGLLEDDEAWRDCLKESSEYHNAAQLRQLFCSILLHSEPADPLALWKEFKCALCEDVLFQVRRETKNQNCCTQ